jgi:hypothetical protein
VLFHGTPVGNIEAIPRDGLRRGRGRADRAGRRPPLLAEGGRLRGGQSSAAICRPHRPWRLLDDIRT